MTRFPWGEEDRMFGFLGRRVPCIACFCIFSIAVDLAAQETLLPPPPVPEDYTATLAQPAEPPVETPPEPLSTAQPRPNVLPETEVQGRLNTFPAEPLPATAVISPTRT